MMDLAPITILLVEDSPTDAKITQKALERGRVKNKLFHVSDGAEAIDFLFHQGAYADPEQAPRPDLILLDLHLPKMDGKEVLSEIKANADLRSIPVIMLTTSQREEDIAKTYELGVNSYITKPVEFEDFLKVVLAISEYWLVISKLPKAV